MKIPWITKDLSVAEYVETNLDGSDYEHGAVETAEATANNCKNYLAKLTALLVEKKLLTEDELTNLL